jgi:hypothetical protein
MLYLRLHQNKAVTVTPDVKSVHKKGCGKLIAAAKFSTTLHFT